MFIGSATSSVTLSRKRTLKWWWRRQVAGFLALRTCAALRGVAGRITVGRPAGLAAASLGSGSGLKYARQGGESWSCLATMQAVTRSCTAGTRRRCRPAPVRACRSGRRRARSKPTAPWPAAIQTENFLPEKSSSTPPSAKFGRIVGERVRIRKHGWMTPPQHKCRGSRGTIQVRAAMERN